MSGASGFYPISPTPPETPFTSGAYQPAAPGPMGAYFPAVQSPYPYTLPADGFNTVIQTFGQNLMWCKSHTCACVAYPTDMSPAGSPNPSCQTCYGRGIYWDPNPVPFTGLLVFGSHAQGAGINPGAEMDPRRGQIVEGEPWVCVTQFAGIVWEEASEFDIFIESDARMRFNTTLTSGPSGIINLPYQQSLEVASKGAVSVWNPATSLVEPVNGYSVSGTSVTIPAAYPANTPYVVEFQAAPAYVAFRSIGGLPHLRVVSQGAISYPKRFRVQPLDLWLREQNVSMWGNAGGYGV